MKVTKTLIERCFNLVELLGEDAKKMPLGEIAERLGLYKSAAHRLLVTLCSIGWVGQDPQTGYYGLTLRLAVLGQKFLMATKIPDICQPVLNNLALNCKELVRLAIVAGGDLTWVNYAQGALSGLIYQPELVAKVTLHATASGKAWLATLPIDEAVKTVLKEGFGEPGRYGPNAIRTVDALIKEINLTKERGWAFVMEEVVVGVSAVAAAIHPQDSNPVGTVSIAGPVMRMGEDRIPEMARLVQEAAKELSALWPLRGMLQAPRELAKSASGHGDART